MWCLKLFVNLQYQSRHKTKVAQFLGVGEKQHNNEINNDTK